MAWSRPPPASIRSSPSDTLGDGNHERREAAPASSEDRVFKLAQRSRFQPPFTRGFLRLTATPRDRDVPPWNPTFLMTTAMRRREFVKTLIAGGLALPFSSLAASTSGTSVPSPSTALNALLPDFDRLTPEEKVRRIERLTS